MIQDGIQNYKNYTIILWLCQCVVLFVQNTVFIYPTSEGEIYKPYWDRTVVWMTETVK